MDFSLTEEQQSLCENASAFAQSHLGKNLVERDRKGAVGDQQWREDWQRCGDSGLLGSIVPEAYGGAGHDVVTTILILEALGYGCPDNGFTLGVNGQIWAVQEPILTFGTEAQKEMYLPGLCDGSLVGAHGMTESATGSDAFSLQTTAQPHDGGYLLNGEKTLIGMAPSCDIALVFASTKPELKQWGVSAFIVEADKTGFTRGPLQEKMGLRTVPMGMISLQDCWVPAANRLGPEGAGASIFHNTMEWERSFIFTSHVGSMRRQLENSIRFAQERAVFGQAIDGYQSVSNRLANMKLRLETSRMLLYRAAWSKQQGNPSAMEAALAKLHISESFVESSMDAIRIHGGRGYLAAYEIERDLRDAMGGVIYSGTSDIQRQIISRMLKDL